MYGHLIKNIFKEYYSEIIITSSSRVRERVGKMCEVFLSELVVFSTSEGLAL